MPEPSPAPDWTMTLCPWAASSRTPAGVSATRYSSDLISLGTPTLIDLLRSTSSSRARARAGRLVEGAARLAGGGRSARPGRDRAPQRFLGLRGHARGKLEQLVVEQARQQRADVRALGRDERADGLLAQRVVDGLLACTEVALPRSHYQRGHAPADAERLEPPRKLRARQAAGHDLGQHVAGQPPLR